MAVNTIPVSARPFGTDAITANGSYTLPQHAFIPHPALQHMANNAIASPVSQGFQTAAIGSVPGIAARPMPTGTTYGLRSTMTQQKVSP